MRVAVQPVPDPGALRAGTTAIIIDVLRATTTLTVALTNGASGVRPAVSPQEAFAMRERERDALLCGERHGVMIAGFDLGNSPADYEPARVRDQTLIFASTNGSLAMRAAEAAGRRVLGAFVNATATCQAVAGASHVTIVCSGKSGRPAMEDLACAGWLATRLVESGAETSGAAARLVTRIAPRTPDDVRRLVTACSHARELYRLGEPYVRDVDFCCRVDVVDEAFEL